MISKSNSHHRFTSYMIAILLFSMLLVGCHSNDLFKEKVDSIEVYEAESDTLATTITDRTLIDSLVDNLETAETSSTANMDLPLPEYNLLFLNEEGAVLQEFGYYIEEKNHGVIGRYWNNDTDTHYNVTTKLDIPGK